ncbi:MAG: bamE [Rickettsiaceae bacterium]|nr:bamE [Rickettsiaceae bacterium]
MKHLLTLLSLVFITSCSQVEKRGYSFELSDYQLVKEKLNNKNDVLELMGYPSFTAEVKNQELWVYYSEDVKKLLFFKPKILDRKIVTIAFGKKDIVEKINSYSLEDQEKIKLREGITRVDSQDKSWWSQIFGNIGQVRAN